MFYTCMINKKNSNSITILFHKGHHIWYADSRYIVWSVGDYSGSGSERDVFANVAHIVDMDTTRKGSACGDVDKTSIAQSCSKS